jgi:hypothetical protein
LVTGPDYDVTPEQTGRMTVGRKIMAFDIPVSVESKKSSAHSGEIMDCDWLRSIRRCTSAICHCVSCYNNAFVYEKHIDKDFS